MHERRLAAGGSGVGIGSGSKQDPDHGCAPVYAGQPEGLDSKIVGSFYVGSGLDQQDRVVQIVPVGRPVQRRGAVGLTLVCGLLRRLHIAHAGIFTLGAYVGLLLTNETGSFAAAFVITVVAVGFFGIAYYEQNAEILKALQVDGGAGPVFPTTENILSGKYAPLSRVIFIYVSTVAAERPEVQTFVEFYLKNAANLVGDVGYVPLPAEMYDLALQRFTTRKTGTVSAMDGVTDTPNSVLQAWKAGA